MVIASSVPVARRDTLFSFPPCPLLPTNTSHCPIFVLFSGLSVSPTLSPRATGFPLFGAYESVKQITHCAVMCVRVCVCLALSICLVRCLSLSMSECVSERPSEGEDNNQDFVCNSHAASALCHSELCVKGTETITQKQQLVG